MFRNFKSRRPLYSFFTFPVKQVPTAQVSSRYPLGNLHYNIRVSSTNCSVLFRLNKYSFSKTQLSIHTWKVNHQNLQTCGILTLSNLDQLHKLKEENMPEKKEFQRLPNTVTPLHYDLYLKPNLKTFVFDGKETVKINVNEDITSITVNCVELEIKDVKLSLKDGSVLSPKVKLYPENETLTMEFDSKVPAGKGTLEIEFSGVLNDKMKGFYRSNISSNDAEPNYAAVTQFEATDARKCFPCWDEPAIKSKFEVTLCVPQNKVALSNMPCNSEVLNDDNTKEVKFACSPLMSTYLVAIVVGDFDYVEDKTTDGVLVRVYTPVGVKEQGKFALYVATKILPYYNEYFGIDYPLPKIDLVAIADFAAGAMENWGLVTYRQACLLVDSENTAASRKQWVAVVVGHELAHQWFGNLVTMEWWTHLWLNEGYASFVENMCVSHLFPEYDIWTQFVTDVYIRALELDCLNNSHPIEVPVSDPEDIDEIFDDISYNKGASVIRMLHQYIGPKVFQEGMHTYLTRHQYGNTFTEDLWKALADVSKKPVREVMSSWTKQMGFPVIKVTEYRHEGDTVTFKVSQQRFTVSEQAAGEEDRLWMVPLTMSIRGHNQIYDEMLEGREKVVTLKGVSKDDWVKINPGTVGFYRTSYPLEMLQLLTPAMKDKSLPPLDRLGIVDDLFALVQAGQCNTSHVLEVISAMRDEDNYSVWSSIVNCLAKLDVLVSYMSCTEELKKFGRNLLKPIGNKLGWSPKPNESHVDTLLRSLVLSRLGWYGDQEVIAEAQKRFADHVSGKAQIPADLRAAIYKTVLSVGNEDTYNTMLKLCREETLQEEKDRIYRSLGAIGDRNILEKVLNFAMSGEVRNQDSVFVIISVAMTKTGRELTWQFMKANWDQLSERYRGCFLLARLIKHTTENFASNEMAEEMQAFFKEKEGNYERSVQQSIESVRLNAAWLERDKKLIQDFLTNKVK